MKEKYIQALVYNRSFAETLEFQQSNINIQKYAL